MPAINRNPEHQPGPVEDHQPYVTHRLTHGNDFWLEPSKDKGPIDFQDAKALKDTQLAKDIKRMGDMTFSINDKTIATFSNSQTTWSDIAQERATQMQTRLKDIHPQYTHAGIDVLGLLCNQWGQSMRASSQAFLMPLDIMLSGQDIETRTSVDIEWKSDGRLLIRSQEVTYHNDQPLLGAVQQMEYSIDTSGPAPTLKLLRHGHDPEPNHLKDSGVLSLTVIDPAIDRILKDKLKPTEKITTYQTRHSGTSTIEWGTQLTHREPDNATMSLPQKLLSLLVKIQKFLFPSPPPKSSDLGIYNVSQSGRYTTLSFKGLRQPSTPTHSALSEKTAPHGPLVPFPPPNATPAALQVNPASPNATPAAPQGRPASLQCARDSLPSQPNVRDNTRGTLSAGA